MKWLGAKNGSGILQQNFALRHSFQKIKFITNKIWPGLPRAVKLLTGTHYVAAAFATPL